MIRRACTIATRGHQDNVDPAIRADVQHHLAKPYSADALLVLLRQVLDEK